MSTIIFSPGIGRVVVSPIDDAESSVSTVSVFTYNVIDRISAFSASAWNIPAQGISTSKAFAFNTEKRMHVYGNIIRYGVVHPIVWPIDKYTFIPSISWNADKRFSASMSSVWKTAQRKSSSKKIAFNDYITLHAHAAMDWNVHLLVRKPGLLIESWYNQIAQPTMHPVDLDNFQVNPYLQYNVKKRISTAKTIRFNSYVKASTKKASAFNTNGILVICQKAVAWETLMRL